MEFLKDSFKRYNLGQDCNSFLVVLDCHLPVLDGFEAVPSINLQDKNSWECQDSNPGPRTLSIVPCSPLSLMLIRVTWLKFQALLVFDANQVRGFCRYIFKNYKN